MVSVQVNTEELPHSLFSTIQIVIYSKNIKMVYEGVIINVELH